MTRKELEEKIRIRLSETSFEVNQQLAIMELLFILADLIEKTETEKEWPKDGDLYFYIDYKGGVYSQRWDRDGDEIDIDIENYSGVYKTKGEAKEVADKVKAFVASLK